MSADRFTIVMRIILVMGMAIGAKWLLGEWRPALGLTLIIVTYAALRSTYR